MIVSNPTGSNGEWFGGVFSQSSSSTSEVTSEGDNQELIAEFAPLGTTTEELIATNHSLETRIAELVAGLIDSKKCVSYQKNEYKEMIHILKKVYNIPAEDELEWNCNNNNMLRLMTKLYPNKKQIIIDGRSLDLQFLPRNLTCLVVNNGGHSYAGNICSHSLTDLPQTLTHLQLKKYNFLGECRPRDCGNIDVLNSLTSLKKLELLECNLNREQRDHKWLPPNLQTLSITKYK